MTEESKLHINAKELLAAFLVVNYFTAKRQKATLFIHLVNRAAVAYIYRPGGTGSQQLQAIARQLWEWCLDHRLTLHAEHLPGLLYVVADYKSQRFHNSSNWMLNPEVFAQVQQAFRSSDCNLFACRTNTQLPSFNNWRLDPEARAADAFTQDWGEVRGYAFSFVLLDWVVFSEAGASGGTLPSNDHAPMASPAMVSQTPSAGDSSAQATTDVSEPPLWVGTRSPIPW